MTQDFSKRIPIGYGWQEYHLRIGGILKSVARINHRTGEFIVVGLGGVIKERGFDAGRRMQIMLQFDRHDSTQYASYHQFHTRK